MMKCFILGLALTPSFALGAETYVCVSKDAETGYTIKADVTLAGAAADVVVSAQGVVACRSVPALVVSGKKPVLNLTGTIACDGDDPEEMILILNTSKKSLSFGDTDFNCK